jgi:hypothetical protein
MKGRQERRRKQLLNDFKENRGYWKLKEEALDRTPCRAHFGRGSEPVAGRTTELMMNKQHDQMVAKLAVYLLSEERKDRQKRP